MDKEKSERIEGRNKADGEFILKEARRILEEKKKKEAAGKN